MIYLQHIRNITKNILIYVGECEIMKLFAGAIYSNEKYSCSCDEYVGHNDEWKCTQCGRPVIITGDIGGNPQVYHRIDPHDLEVGMFLLVSYHFYRILHIYPPIGEKRIYVNLQGYGQTVVNLNNYAIVSI